MKNYLDIINLAKNVISIELESIKLCRDKIDNNFYEAVNLILSSKGRLIVVGVGKSANIAKKIVATFNSTGQPSIFLHAGDASHGDLGNIQNEDIVLILSKSGNTTEIVKIVPIIKEMGNKVISITSIRDSFLTRESNIIIDSTIKKEACPLNLAPTTSSTVQLILGDALAVCLLESKNFTKEDFARFHPGGTLGKRLTLKVAHLINNQKPIVYLNTSLAEVIGEISKSKIGATAVLDNTKIVGIITDGDLRRMLQSEKDIKELTSKNIMSKEPITIDKDTLAYDALLLMKKKNINQLLVLSQNKYIGAIHIHDIIKEGIL